jgi:hypothetical protein
MRRLIRWAHYKWLVSGCRQPFQLTAFFQIKGATLKPELEYLKLALDEWYKDGHSRSMILLAINIQQILTIALKLRKADADKLDQPAT